MALTPRANSSSACGTFVADDLVVGATEAFGQGPLPGQVPRHGAGEAVAAGDVHGQQVRALGAGGDAGGAADQRVAFRAAGQRDHDPSRASQVPAMPWSAR